MVFQHVLPESMHGMSYHEVYITLPAYAFTNAHRRSHAAGSALAASVDNFHVYDLGLPQLRVASA
jgi:hypothetical protein